MSSNTVVLFGLIQTANLALMGWLFILYVNERKNRVWQVNEIYNRIDKEKNLMNACRQDLEDSMNKRMTEPQIKDFVDRTVKPLSDDLTDVKIALRHIEQSNSDIHTAVEVQSSLIQTLIDK